MRFFAWYIFILSCGFSIKSAISANEDRYEIQYRIKIASLDTKHTYINQCLITSVPINYAVAKEEIDAEPHTLLVYNFPFCSPNPPAVLPTFPITANKMVAVMTVDTGKCPLIEQIRNARASNIKILMIKGRLSNQNILTNFYQELNQFPIVIFGYSQNDLDHIESNMASIAIYGSMGSNHLGFIVTKLLIFFVIIFSVVSIIVVTVVFHKERLLSMDTTDVKNVKWMMIILPVVMIGTLLLLYYFYNVMVWIYIIFFFFATAFITSRLVMTFVHKYNCIPNYTYPFNKFGFNTIEPTAIGFFAIGLIIATLWIVNRKNMIGIVLNNVIGIIICIEVSLVFGFLFVASKNFRLLLIVLASTFVIDALMVYIKVQSDNKMPISPYQNISNHSLIRLKRNSESRSIMEEVAIGTAGTSAEEVPVRFKIPLIEINYEMSSQSCQNSTNGFSLTGFGDVIIPGSFIVFILVFSVTVSTASTVLYSVFMLFCYIIGYFITIIMVFVSGKGQPALVFLLPCLIIPTMLLTLVKKDFMTLWNHTWSLNQSVPLQQFVQEVEMYPVDGDNKNTSETTP